MIDPHPRTLAPDTRMARVLGIDHIVLRVGDLQRSRAFYDAVLGFLGFFLEWDLGDTLGWNNHRTMFWIAQAEKKGKHREGAVGFHHYAFELARRKDVDDLYKFLVEHEIEIVDPPADYPSYGKGYYAVFFRDPDGLKLEGMYFEEKRDKLRPRH
jgi:catechol 2,3-dioxygenase-like lactoylglutathione lyase family enzyme